MNKARAELIVKALNRKYPQAVSWQMTMRPDGVIQLTAGWLVRRMPARVFHDSPSGRDIWDHIEKYWDLDHPDLLERERKRLSI